LPEKRWFWSGAAALVAGAAVFSHMPQNLVIPSALLMLAGGVAVSATWARWLTKGDGIVGAIAFVPLFVAYLSIAAIVAVIVGTLSVLVRLLF
jgi:hypothetical protein